MIDHELLVKTRTNTRLSYTSAIPSFLCLGSTLRKKIFYKIETVIASIDMGRTKATFLFFPHYDIILCI